MIIENTAQTAVHILDKILEYSLHVRDISQEYK